MVCIAIMSPTLSKILHDMMTLQSKFADTSAFTEVKTTLSVSLMNYTGDGDILSTFRSNVFPPFR